MKITVVIPAHNAARFLDATLDSIEAQTLLPDEIIVVNDGSSDGTGAIARKRGVRVVDTKGIGAAGALNAGIAESQTDLIAHFDADDVMLPEKLATQVSCIEQEASSRLGLVSSNLRMFDEKSVDRVSFIERAAKRPEINALLNHASVPFQTHHNRLQDTKSSRLFRWGPTESVKLICRAHVIDVKGVYLRESWERVGGFRSTYQCAYDMDFVWRVSRHYDVALVEEVLFHGRQHVESLSANSHLVASECARLFEEMLSHPHAHGFKENLRLRKRVELLDVAYIHRKQRRWLASASSYLKAALA